MWSGNKGSRRLQYRLMKYEGWVSATWTEQKVNRPMGSLGESLILWREHDRWCNQLGKEEHFNLMYFIYPYTRLREIIFLQKFSQAQLSNCVKLFPFPRKLLGKFRLNNYCNSVFQIQDWIFRPKTAKTWYLESSNTTF